MDATYIIFKKVPSQGCPAWIETVDSLEKGKKRLMHYTSRSNEEYYLFDVSQARVVNVLAKGHARSA